jgi:uncharacterized linocin/CFP29 family protein
MNNIQPMAYNSTLSTRSNGTNLGREKLPWSKDIWDRIDQAVHDECLRTKIARKFIPLYGPVSPGVLTVPSDSIRRDGKTTLLVNEGDTTPLVEILVEFTLTSAQVDREAELMTAVTLATRAANHLAQAEDILIFQGHAAVAQHPLFVHNHVQWRSGPSGKGLLNAATREDKKTTQIQMVDVDALQVGQPTSGSSQVPQSKQGPRWGVNTFEAVADAYSRLQGGEGLEQAHYGPYALILRTEPYADTYAPVLTNQATMPNTLVITADRIRPLVTAGFCGTGTLPMLRGLLVSLGGNTMDLVVGMDSTTAFLQEDTQGQFRFRVFERFALRIKDPSAVMRLEFNT